MATVTHSTNGAYRDPEDAYVELMTPDRCRDLLDACEDRPLVSPATIKRHATEIHQGQWKKIRKRIVVDPDGKLTDGHAALEGIIMAGVPVKVIVDVQEPPMVLLDSPRFTSQAQRSSASQPDVSIQVITPEMAKAWLDTVNINNRNIRPKQVAILARKMTEGRWHFSHQGIAFAGNGELLDGQHRLRAIVQSGVSVSMVVTRGLPIESVISMDVGATRSLADMFGKLTLGKRIDNRISATARRMRASISPESHVEPSGEFWIDYITNHEQAIHFACSHLSIKEVRIAPFRAVVARAWYSQDHERLIQFCQVLTSGVCDGRRDGAAARLRTMYTRDRKTYTGNDMRAALCCKTESAIRSFLKGQDLTLIRPTSIELFPLSDDK